MSTKLYVGNLPYSTTKEALAELFSQAGNIVDAVVITDRETGRSKGFGFVEMSTEEEAATAISTLNGTAVEDRTIVVNEARPRQE